jgi:hypothetical protein
MSTSIRQITRLGLLGCGRTLIALGAFVFLLGDRLLREVFQFSFMYAEGIGLLSGILIMVIGALMQYAAKSIEHPAPRPETDHPIT